MIAGLYEQDGIELSRLIKFMISKLQPFNYIIGFFCDDLSFFAKAYRFFRKIAVLKIVPLNR